VTWRSKLSRASGIGISGFSVTRKSSQEESRNSETRDGPTVIALQWRTGVTHIGVRDLESSVN
jgi:hypothetical protein